MVMRIDAPWASIDVACFCGWSSCCVTFGLDWLFFPCRDSHHHCRAGSGRTGGVGEGSFCECRGGRVRDVCHASAGHADCSSVARSFRVRQGARAGVRSRRRWVASDTGVARRESLQSTGLWSSCGVRFFSKPRGLTRRFQREAAVQGGRVLWHSVRAATSQAYVRTCPFWSVQSGQRGGDHPRLVRIGGRGCSASWPCPGLRVSRGGEARDQHRNAVPRHDGHRGQPENTCLRSLMDEVSWASVQALVGSAFVHASEDETAPAEYRCCC